MKMITASGRVTRDPRTNNTRDGTTVLSFSLAVNDWNGKEKGTEFFDVSVWGKRGESLGKYIVKGTALTVAGDLGRREHEGRTYFTIRADHVTLQGGAKANDEPAKERGKAPAGGADGYMSDDIPFNMEWR